MSTGNALFPASWRRLDAFHSDLCGSAGSGVITECVWVDCFVFELAFATIFLAASVAAPYFSAPVPPPPAASSSSSSSSSAAAAAAPSPSRRLEPWLRFELQQRAPTLVFAALGLAFIADLILAGDTAFWTDWEHAFPASLQVFGALAIGFWANECVMIVFALYTFPEPPPAVRRDSVRHAVARSSGSGSGSGSGHGSMVGLAHPWDGMPEWEDAVPAALNITLMATVLVTKSFGAFGVALIAAHAAAPLCSAAAELIALRWWVRAAAAERLRAAAAEAGGAETVLVFTRPPYSSIRHMKPSNKISFTLLTVLAEWAAAATRFVSGPMALYHLWRARHTMPLGVCLIFILGTLRETAVYVLAALATLASVAPRRLGLAWLRPPQMRSEKLLGDED